MVIKKRFASPKKSTPLKSRRRSVARGASSLSAKKLGGGLSANIQVAVRVRPENEREQAGSYDNVINCVDEKMLIFDPKDCEQQFFFKGKKQTMRDLNKKQKKNKTFTFDRVYSENSTNEQVFEGTTKGIVNTLFDGYNCCVFAYGATGAGKTHTMLGNKDNPGITFMTMKEIFTRVESSEEINFEVFLSYIEVYNENIRDLMEPSKSLIIRDDGKSGTTISGMTMLKPKSPDEVLDLLSMGNSNRSQHPTDHNKESSRSHAILQIIVQQKPKDAGLSAEVKTAKLSMIDLAGSEKGSATGHKGERFREGSNINKSLLALGNCINALAAGSKYIPYRDSKLTRLLKDSVGGNCATVMIANISPSSLSYEDTLNTLKYADRAKQIKVDLKKNVVNVDFHVAQYAKIVEDLRTEIESLKQKIKTLEDENEKLKDSGGSQVPGPSDAGSVADRLAAASVNQTDIDMEDLDSLSMITKLRQQLGIAIERQKDYDQLQQRITHHKELEDNLQEENLKLKEGSEVTRKENDALRSNLTRLKHQMTALQEKSVRDNSDSTLEELIRARDATLEEIGSERSRLSILELRVHYRALQAERGHEFGVGGIEKERVDAKMKRTMESLKKKVEKKKQKLDTLLTKFNDQNRSIQDQLTKNPASLTAFSAPSILSLGEHKTENILLHCVISSMGRELNRLHKDFMQVIPYLIKNEKLLRAHGISSQQDKDMFSELQALVQSSETVVFADTVNNTGSDELNLEESVFKECSTLNLPSLSYTRRKSSSMEQQILSSDILLEATQDERGCDQTDSGGVKQDPETSQLQPSSSSSDKLIATEAVRQPNVCEAVYPNEAVMKLDSNRDVEESPLRPIESAESIINKYAQDAAKSSNKVTEVAPSDVDRNEAVEKEPFKREAVKMAAARSEAVKTEDVESKAARAEAVKTAAARSEAVKMEAVLGEAVKTAAAQKEAVKIEAVKSSCSVADKIKEILSSEELPPTPQVTRQNSGSSIVLPPGIEPRNKSFLDRLPINRNNKASDLTYCTPPPDSLNSTVTIQSSQDYTSDRPSIDVPAKRPPPLELLSSKRNFTDSRMDGSEESPGKRARLLDETYDQDLDKRARMLNQTYDQDLDTPSAWLAHRRVSAIPDSPLVLGQLAQSPASSVVSQADSTFTKDEEDAISPGSTPAKSDTKGFETGDGGGALNVTGGDNLLAQLHSKCQLKPSSDTSDPTTSQPTAKEKTVNLDGTFPVGDVSDEPMEVDETSNLNNINNLNNLDNISPVKPSNSSNLLSVLNKSPVRARIGTSPKYVKRNTPSPLRESTLLDFKAKKTTEAGTNGAKQVTAKPAGHQRSGSTSGQQTGQTSGQQTSSSSGHPATVKSVPGASSVSKGFNKLKILSSTKGKRTLTSSKSTGSLLKESASSMLRETKPAAAHKLNLPYHPTHSGGAGRGRSPGRAGLGAGAGKGPGSPNYAQSTLSSSNKASTLERRPKGTENQKPGGARTGLKRSSSSVGRPR